MIAVESLPLNTRIVLRLYIIELMETICNGDALSTTYRHAVTTENMTDYRAFLDHEPS